MNNYRMKTLIIACLMIGLTTYAGASIAQTYKKPASKKTTDQQPQKFDSKEAEVKAKASAFLANAKSFKNMIDSSDESSIMKQQKTIISVIDATLDNNATMQALVKDIAKEQSNDQKKNFYMREILPNLQNINRQLARIKDSIDKDNVNYKNAKLQAERVEESIGQVIDRLNKNVDK